MEKAELLRKAGMLKKTFVNRDHLTVVMVESKAVIVYCEDDLLRVFDEVSEEAYVKASKIIS